MRKSALPRPASLLYPSVLFAAIAAGPLLAQSQQQYPPPPDQQYPQQQQQPQYPPPQPYPQTQQYPPPTQGQYPQTQYPPQAQYPPVQGQYPPPQGVYAQPPMLPPQQLDQLVQSIALYPDGLLAQVLTASTFYNQLPDAAAWANQHSYIQGPALADAIRQDNLPWDPSVLALLPFPNVLNQMANNTGWTQALGSAVLAQRNDVMDAVQRMRQEAYNYGYLRTNQYERVIYGGPNYIEIVPVRPDFYYVPYYSPYVVFARPRPGVFVEGALRFGPGIYIGAAFAPWGWGGAGFGWREHTILVGNRPWDRTWVNRGVYPRPYPDRRVAGPAAEHHELRGPAHYEGREREHEHEHDGGHEHH